jgi:hypothetical protein
MEIKNFKQLHRDAVGLGESSAKINVTLGKIYNSDTDQAKYLSWTTSTAKDLSQGKAFSDQFALEVKAVQKNVNLTNTQKLMLWGEVRKEALDKKVRFMRANKPLLTKGLCTQAEIDAKAYKFVVSDIVPIEHTFETDLIALMTKYSADNSDVKKVLKIK